MKNKQLKRLISIIFIVLFMLILPVSGFYQGQNHVAYAANLEIVQGATENIFPVVSYWMASFNNTVTAEDIANGIDEMKENFSTSWNIMPDTVKLTNAFLFTDLTLDDINLALGTSYSESTISDLGLPLLQQKIANNEKLNQWDLKRLGVMDMFAYSLKDSIVLGTPVVDYNQVLDFGTYKVHVENLNNYNFYIAQMHVDPIFNYFPVTVTANQTLYYTLNSTMHQSYIYNLGTYEFTVNGEVFQISYKNYLGDFDNTSVSSNNLTDKTIVGLNTATSYMANKYISSSAIISYYSHVFLAKMVNGVLTKVGNTSGYTSNSISAKRDFLTLLYQQTGIDFTNTIIYSSDSGLDTIMDNTWEGTATYGSIDTDLDINDLRAGILGQISTPDTSLTQAEKVIQDIADQGVDVTQSQVNVKSYENDEGGTEIILTPADPSIPQVDTGNPSDSFPDTSGDIGDGTIKIPILGSILAWLKKIWDLIRQILDHLLNNPGSAADEGIDWGNFKGFFDIFYIFYYLIIIIILILLKFLATVLNMMNIPANTALFDSYPTMLQGINYLKNLKVGGFTITIQQILEYMFTVFFFLFVVTVLQKLYHSFTSIERQQERADKQIRFNNSDYENIHYEDRR